MSKLSLRKLQVNKLISSGFFKYSFTLIRMLPSDSKIQSLKKFKNKFVENQKFGIKVKRISESSRVYINTHTHARTRKKFLSKSTNLNISRLKTSF